MTVVAIGLNHASAPADVLQEVSLPADTLPKALTELAASPVVTEAVVVSTCNRVEFYVHAERFHDGFRDVRSALSLLAGVAPERFDEHLYVHYHDDAARHLFEVAAGLDSVILGEHEILGQIARSWELAREEGSTGPVLNLLFQRAVEAGKKVRTDTDIGRSTAALPHAAVSLLTERSGSLDGARVLVVGAGEVGTSVAAAMCRKFQLGEVVVTNRTGERAEALAAELGGRTVPFAALAQAVGEVEVIISATGAPSTVIGIDALRAGAGRLTAEGRRPRMVVLDLALPADVPAEARLLDGLDLIDLPQLQDHANRGVELRRSHLGAARGVVDGELDRYRSAASARQVAPLVGSLHTWAEAIRAGELDRYASRLSAMGPEDRAAVEALSRSIVAKMLHQPTVAVKDAAGSAKGERLADALRELFDLS